MIEFEAVLPIGARTCCDLPAKTGAHNHRWLMQDVEEFATEYAALVSGQLDSALSRPQHLDALAILRSLMKRATKGQLIVGDNNKVPARVIRRVPYLLELRPGKSRNGDRLFRLYYAEPRAIDGALLPLVLSTKPAGRDHNEEQNESIEDAKARSRTWTLFNARRYA